jgi:hypothetical protein
VTFSLETVILTLSWGNSWLETLGVRTELLSWVIEPIKGSLRIVTIKSRERSLEETSVHEGIWSRSTHSFIVESTSRINGELIKGGITITGILNEITTLSSTPHNKITLSKGYIIIPVGIIEEGHIQVRNELSSLGRSHSQDIIIKI